MPYKDIVIHIDDSKSCQSRIDVGITLARPDDGHVTGVYVKPSIYLPAYVAAQVGAEVIDTHAKIANDAAEAAKAAFMEQAGKHGVDPEWRIGDGPVEEVVALNARYSDLIVVGQTDPDGDSPADATDVPGHVVIYAGRPVLVVPYAGQFEAVGERVLVAWNGSREAARAVNDALPMLQAAKSVTVLAVNPEVGPDKLGELPGADISLHLARHGVKAEASQVFADDLDVGDMVLSRASDLGVDMIVMGGYGRSRLRELVMGGASRHLLSHMTVPIFMSH